MVNVPNMWNLPPPGYKPGQTRVGLIWDVAVPLGCIAIFLACLRFYVRIRLVKVFGKDDWLLVAAVFFLCFHIAGEIWQAVLGIGKHQYDLNREIDPRKLMAPSALVIAAYKLGQCCVQCSILAFYLRLGLAMVGGRHMRRIIYILMGIAVISNSIAIALSLLFSMVPSYVLQPHKYFIPFWFTYGTFNLLLDLAIWSIPLPGVFSVMHNLSIKERILLGMAFSLGMMCWCTVVLRISLRKYAGDLAHDPTYNAPIINLFTMAEVSIAISCVSLVTLGPLVAQVTKGFNSLRGKPTASSGHDSGESQTLAQYQSESKGGSGTGPRSPRTTLKRGQFGEHTIVGQELKEWKDDTSNVKCPQFVQRACSCPCRGDDVELGGIVAHAPSCPRFPNSARGTQLQVPTPATIIDHGTIHRSSCSSSGETLRTTDIGSPRQGTHSQPHCDTLYSSESTVNLTNADTNTTIT